MVHAKLLLAVFLGLIPFNHSQASSIAYAKVRMGRIVAHTVTVNLSDQRVRVTVAMAKGGTGSSESFKSMINRTRPAAAITGTFFDTRTLIPTGDIALFGTVVHSGCIGSALCIDSTNKAAVVPLSDGRRSFWAGYETVLCAGPTLVRNGKIAIALKHEGFRRSLEASTRRTAVGITKSGKLLLVAINRKASLYQLARLMLKLNVVDALLLDGGSSTAIYANRNYLAVPSRSLTNCLVIYGNAVDYQNAKTALAPARYFAQAEAKQPATIASLALR